MQKLNKIAIESTGNILYKKKKYIEKSFILYYVLGALRAKLNNEWYLSQNTCLVQPFQFF